MTERPRSPMCHGYGARWAARGDDPGCWHRDCQIADLRAAGRNVHADRLEANDHAKDWQGNWGRMLYDPKDHGRDPVRRTAMAKVIRAMRNRTADYADAVRAGCWAGALLPRAS